MTFSLTESLLGSSSISCNFTAQGQEGKKLGARKCTGKENLVSMTKSILKAISCY